jgi:hypothetical protein
MICNLTNAVTPNSALVNTATLVSYAGAEGAANHIPGGLTETATVTVATPVVDKVITTTNQASHERATMSPLAKL